MPLIKDNVIVDDTWRVLGDDDPLGDGDVLVSLERWQSERGVLAQRKGRVGVQLKSDQPPALIEEDLATLDLVALEFPTFKDGRAFSYARLLRERYGFKGEVRAVGEVLRDQAFYMQRCGFNAYDVAEGSALEGWVEALDEFTAVYQPSFDGRSTVSEHRHMRQAAE